MMPMRCGEPLSRNVAINPARFPATSAVIGLWPFLLARRTWAPRRGRFHRLEKFETVPVQA